MVAGLSLQPIYSNLATGLRALLFLHFLRIVFDISYFGAAAAALGLNLDSLYGCSMSTSHASADWNDDLLWLRFLLRLRCAAAEALFEEKASFAHKNVKSFWISSWVNVALWQLLACWKWPPPSAKWEYWEAWDWKFSSRVISLCAAKENLVVVKAAREQPIGVCGCGGYWKLFKFSIGGARSSPPLERAKEIFGLIMSAAGVYGMYNTGLATATTSVSCCWLRWLLNRKVEAWKACFGLSLKGALAIGSVLDYPIYY